MHEWKYIKLYLNKFWNWTTCPVVHCKKKVSELGLLRNVGGLVLLDPFTCSPSFWWEQSQNKASKIKLYKYVWPQEDSNKINKLMSTIDR